MKVFIAVIFCSAMLALVDSCDFGFCRDKLRFTVSDKRQFSCLLDSPSLDKDVYYVKFEERGTTVRCRQLVENDPDHDSKLQYPAAPEVIDNSETLAVANVGGTETAVCVHHSKSSFDELVAQLAPKGYILVSDMKKEKNYACVENPNTGRRSSRGILRSC